MSSVLLRQNAGVLTIHCGASDPTQGSRLEFYERIIQAVRSANADPAVGAIVMEGAGEVFDLHHDAAHAGVDEREHVELLCCEPLLGALAATQKPIVAAMQGRLAGVALSILVLCDQIYLADDAQLTGSAAILSAVPEVPSLFMARVGYLRAFELLTLGKPIDGRTAVSWGLARSAAPAGELHAQAHEAALKLAEASASSTASVIAPLKASLQGRSPPILH